MAETKRPSPSDALVDSVRVPRAGHAPAGIAPSTATVEEWQLHKGTEAPFFAAAKSLQGWAIGSVVDEADYDDAIDAAKNVELR